MDQKHNFDDISQKISDAIGGEKITILTDAEIKTLRKIIVFYNLVTPYGPIWWAAIIAAAAVLSTFLNGKL